MSNNELINYTVRDANWEINNNPFDNNVFYPADGVSPSDGMDDFSNAGGMRARRKARQARRDMRVKSRATARENRTNAKVQQSIAQQKAGEALANSDAPVSGGRMNMENVNVGTTKKKGGLSKGAKIGIGVGVALLLGIVTFVVIKKMKK